MEKNNQKVLHDLDTMELVEIHSKANIEKYKLPSMYNAVEELGELIQAISKYFRMENMGERRPSEEKMLELRENIISEVADVYVVMENILRAFEITDTEVAIEVRRKLLRSLHKLGIEYEPSTL